MTFNRDIAERDLLAYADGMLDQDPGRRRAVEAWLADHPAQAARLRAYAVQNEEIRRHYAPVLAEPVPDRFLHLLEAPPGAGRAPVLRRAAAALGLLLLGGGFGWLASHLAPGEQGLFVSRIAAGYHSTAAVQPVGLSGGAGQPGWLSEQVAVNVDVPDLTRLGLHPVSRSRLPGEGGHSSVRIEYADAGGGRVVLIMGTRWRDEVPQVHLSEQGGLQIAHWQDGPFLYGLAAEEGGMPLEPIAETIAQRQDRSIRPIAREPEMIRDVRTIDGTRPIGTAPPLPPAFGTVDMDAQEEATSVH